MVCRGWWVFEPVDDFLKDLEADFLAVAVEARPVADQDGRLASAR